MDLLQLPDDVLVVVMQFLPVPDVFTCRLVSKRLGNLALDWDVWCHRLLDQRKDPWMCAVLRLAPCLDMMSTALPLKSCCHIPYTTNCAVAGLDLDVRDGGNSSLFAAMVIRNQERFGRLRSIKVSLAWDTSLTELSVIFGTLVATAGIKRLKLETWEIKVDGPIPAVHNSVPIASLESFECTLTGMTAAFCNSIISVHCSTLTEVLFDYHTCDPPVSPTLARLLAGASNLETLECPLLPGMQALAACPKLRTVRLGYHAPKNDPQSLLRDGAAFFRHATQLKRVHLTICVAHPSPPADVAVGLVLAMGASGKSHIRHLTVVDDEKDADDQYSLQRLASALPSLAALRHLRLEGPPAQLLPALSPATTSALRMLLMEPWSQPMGCIHAWVHSDQVKTVLMLNPRLHIVIVVLADKCEIEDCQACSLGCHKDCWDYEDVGVFSHDSAKRCSLHDDGQLWIRVP